MPLLGGVRPPVAALLSLLLAVAAVTVLALGRSVALDVSPAVLSSQQHVAEDAASEVRAVLDQDAATLRHQAAQLSDLTGADGANAAVDTTGPLTADGLLKRLTTLGHTWLGTAVAESGTGRLLAVSGEQIPASAVQAAATASTSRKGKPVLITLPDHETRLLVSASVGGHILVATDSIGLTAPGGDLTRGFLLVDGHGRTVASLGPALVGAQDQRIPTSSARASAQRGGSAGVDRNSGYLVGDLHTGKRTVAGWADVAPANDPVVHPLGLTAVVVMGTPQTSNVTGDSLLALTAAGALLLAALLVTLLLVLRLQRPLLRLHLGAARISRGDLSRPVALARGGEAARVGHALDALRRQLHGESPEVFRPLRRVFGARAVVVVCALLLASWGVPLLLMFTRPVSATAVPVQLVADQQTRTVAAAERMRQSLAAGYQDVAGVAAVLDSTATPDRAQRLLATALEQHSRYRTLYLVARNGTVLTSVGKQPRQTPGRLTGKGGLVQVNTDGKIPVLDVWAPVPKARPTIPGQQPVDLGPFTPVAVVGEFDISVLDTTLDHPGMGNVWLVDDRQKVVASRSGYLAYQNLPTDRLAQLAQSASQAPQSRLVPDGADQDLIAAAPLGVLAGVSTQFDWQVVSSQPSSWLDLGAYRTQRLTMLAGLLGLTAGLGCLGWLHVIVVRPLRSLAVSAEKLAAGDRRTVLYPVHHDEVGSVLRSLELLRQQLAASSTHRRTPPSARI